MKHFLALLLTLCLLFALTGTVHAEDYTFSALSDPALLQYMEDDIYDQLVTSLDSDQYFVENVSLVYISQEYLDEVAYNSQANIFFGYTLAELNEQFVDSKYVFTLGEDGTTTVEPFVDYDDTYDRILKNVAVGTGVILVCVTVSVVTAGTGTAAVSMIFAMSAKSAAIAAASGGIISGASSGIITGIQTGDMDSALKSAALGASEGFKMGAISGALSGGLSEAVALKGATLNGLTMNEAAIIQRESHYPLDVIKSFSSMEQYEICQNAGLTPYTVNNNVALIRDIDLDFVDDLGRTNLERMQSGLAALDPSGQAYELHHIGQRMDSTLAILTKEEHMQGGNDTIWHLLGEGITSQIDRQKFAVQRESFWS